MIFFKAFVLAVFFVLIPFGESFEADIVFRYKQKCTSKNDLISWDLTNSLYYTGGPMKDKNGNKIPFNEDARFGGDFKQNTTVGRCAIVSENMKLLATNKYYEFIIFNGQQTDFGDFDFAQIIIGSNHHVISMNSYYALESPLVATAIRSRLTVNDDESIVVQTNCNNACFNNLKPRRTTSKVSLTIKSICAKSDAFISWEVINSNLNNVLQGNVSCNTSQTQYREVEFDKDYDFILYYDLLTVPLIEVMIGNDSYKVWRGESDPLRKGLLKSTSRFHVPSKGVISNVDWNCNSECRTAVPMMASPPLPVASAQVIKPQTVDVIIRVQTSSVNSFERISWELRRTSQPIESIDYDGKMIDSKNDLIPNFGNYVANKRHLIACSANDRLVSLQVNESYDLYLFNGDKMDFGGIESFSIVIGNNVFDVGFSSFLMHTTDTFSIIKSRISIGSKQSEYRVESACNYECQTVNFSGSSLIRRLLARNE